MVCLFVCLFSSFSCLFTLARIPSRTLNTNGESQNSFPSAEIRGEAFIISPSSMMFDVIFVEVFYLVEENSLGPNLLEVFKHE